MFNSIRLWIHQTLGECVFEGVSVNTTEGNKQVCTTECSHELCSNSVRSEFPERDLSYSATTSGRMQSLAASGLNKPRKPLKSRKEHSKEHNELMEEIFIADAVMESFEVSESEPSPEPTRYRAPEPDYSSVHSNSQDSNYSSVSSNSSYSSGDSSDQGSFD